jgi:hypothetical protein
MLDTSHGEVLSRGQAHRFELVAAAEIGHSNLRRGVVHTRDRRVAQSGTGQRRRCAAHRSRRLKPCSAVAGSTNQQRRCPLGYPAPRSARRDCDRLRSNEATRTEKEGDRGPARSQPRGVVLSASPRCTRPSRPRAAPARRGVPVPLARFRRLTGRPAIAGSILTTESANRRSQGVRCSTRNQCCSTVGDLRAGSEMAGVLRSPQPAAISCPF